MERCGLDLLALNCQGLPQSHAIEFFHKLLLIYCDKDHALYEALPRLDNPGYFHSPFPMLHLSGVEGYIVVNVNLVHYQKLVLYERT